MSRPSALRVSALAAGSCLVSSLLASPCAAEPGLSLAGDVAPAGDAALMTSGADARGDGLFRARALVDYVARPLVLVDDQQREEAVVSEQLWLRLGLSFSLWHRLLVYADLPYAAHVAEDAAPGQEPLAPHPSESHGLGDVMLGARVRLLGPSGLGTQLAVGAELWAPTGNEAAYAGDGTARARLYTSVGASHRRTQWAAQAGFTLRASERFDGILPTRTGSSLLLAASLRTAIDGGAQVFLGPEMFASFVVADGASLFDPRSTAIHLLAGGRYRPAQFPLELGAGVGPGLGHGAGSGDYRALVFIGFAPEVPPPPPDRDGDGVPDARDICLGLPGVASADPLMDGCPAAPLDSDGDGIPEAFDACPREAGLPTRTPRTHGCPKLADRDADTIADRDDACPDEKGVASSDPGKNGCAPPPPPPPPAANLVAEKIVISEQVQFETGTAQLRPESDGILTQVARVLGEHPELELVEVEGHTDDTGSPDLNRRLSQERASAVRTWLVAHGIAGSRLLAKGYGQERPLEDNQSEAGRAKNRRVEFRVVRGPGTQGGPR